MKKLLAIAACASAVAAFGANDVMLDLGEVGVTAVTSSTTNTIVAVSYTDLDAGNVTASNLVKTTNLKIGDHLYVYNDGHFRAFVLAGEENGVKYWNGVGSVEPKPDGIELTNAISADADGARLAVGTGVWLVRGSAWEDGQEFTFYIYGKPATETSVQITSGTTKLVGNPTQEDKAPKFPAGASPNNGDRVLIPTSGGSMQTWTYNSTQNKWGYRDTTTGERNWQEDLPNITAGTGFWYVATGAVTITW